MKAIFLKIQSLKMDACFKLVLTYLEVFLEVGNARVPKKPN